MISLLNENDEKMRDKNLNEFLKKFEIPIKRALFQTNLQEREDLEQELLLKIFLKSKNLSFKENAPEFWGFFKV